MTVRLRTTTLSASWTTLAPSFEAEPALSLSCAKAGAESRANRSSIRNIISSALTPFASYCHRPTARSFGRQGLDLGGAGGCRVLDASVLARGRLFLGRLRQRRQGGRRG